MRLPIELQRWIFKHICPEIYAGTLTITSQLKQSQNLGRKAAGVHNEAIHEVARLNQQVDQLQSVIDHLRMVNASYEMAKLDIHAEVIIPLANETFIVPSHN